MVTEMTLAEDLYKMWPPPLADEEQAVNALVHDLATCPLYDLPRLLTIRAKAMRLLAVTDHQPPVARLTQRESDALEALIRLSGRRKRQITTTAIAVELLVHESWAYRLLAHLREKGYVRRTGGRRDGGWVLVAPYEPFD